MVSSKRLSPFPLWVGLTMMMVMATIITPIAAFLTPPPPVLRDLATRAHSSSGLQQRGAEERPALLWSRALLHGVTLPLLILSTLAPGAGAAERGQVLFDNNCSSCHVGGGNVIGYARGKTLQADALKKNKYDTKQSIVTLLEQGKGVMPKYASYVKKNGDVAPAKLSTQEMETVADYVLRQAKSGWK